MKATLSRSKKQELFLYLREKRIRKARLDFWEFCKLLEPDFYKEHRWHLKLLCETLQKLLEGTLINPETNKPYKKLILNIPPRHGKSRTLVNFCRWALGKNNNNRIITASYNDDQASEFSRFTRDGIKEEKTFGYEVIFNDIFPDTKIKQGNSSFEKWALEKQFFNYKGAGVGGSITGKGCNIAICDDLIKDADTAYNESALDKIWLWYTGTFLSRKETGSIEIMNMTRWSKKDPCGRILRSKAGKDWYVLKLEAFDGENMLCSDLLTKEEYDFLADPENFDNAIFRANYHQEPLDVKGQLYSLKTYDTRPKHFERIIAFGDTADQGKDWFSMPIGGVLDGDIYILDWLYTKDPYEITEGLAVDMLSNNKVDLVKIESNAGGRQFARNIEKLLRNTVLNKTYVKWFAQTNNKIGRILVNSSGINAHVFLPKDFHLTHRQVFNDLMSFQKEAKNKHDDAPDSLTGLYEMINYIDPFGGL